MVKNAINIKTPASGALIALRRETYVGAARLTLVSGFLCTWASSFISKTRSTKLMSQKLICSACGHIGSSKTAIKGNGLIEIVLWLFFIIPGLIYSIWRSSSRYKVCKKCGSTNLIPLDSPIGQKVLADQGKTLEQAMNEKEPPRIYTRSEKVLIGLVVVTVIALIYFISNAV